MCVLVGQVVGGCVMFSVVVCHVVCSFAPVESELTLGGMAPAPMEAHPNHFDPSLDYCIADEARGGRVVHLDRGSGLFPPHFFKGILEGDHFPGCGVKRSKFCFCSCGHDEFEDVGNGEYRSIVSGNWVILGQEDVCTHSTA